MFSFKRYRGDPAKKERGHESYNNVPVGSAAGAGVDGLFLNGKILLSNTPSPE